jgi:hypothetical protein
MGDLAQQYPNILRQYGVFKADIWYWFQTIGSILPYIAQFLKKAVEVTAILRLIGK